MDEDIFTIFRISWGAFRYFGILSFTDIPGHMILLPRDRGNWKFEEVLRP